MLVTRFHERFNVKENFHFYLMTRNVNEAMVCVYYILSWLHKHSILIVHFFNLHLVFLTVFVCLMALLNFP